MKKLEKRHIVLSILILLVIVLGGSYAYWTVVIKNNNVPMNLQASDLKIIFTDNSEIIANNIEPGWKETKTFKIENQSDKDFEYNIIIEDLINTFETSGNLQYKITSTNGYNMVDYKDIPKSEEIKDEIISEVITIKPNEVQEYRVEFIYKKVEEDQSMDMGKIFSGVLVIEENRKIEPFYDKLLADHPKVETRSDYSTPVGGTEITNETTSGVIYKTTKPSEIEEGEPIYYFAGNPSDNWVKFAGYYWRIIRTNHDKSIRLLYAGTSPDTTEGYIETSSFNNVYEDTMAVGWKYGTSGSQVNNRTNENSSRIRDVVLEWYNTNIKANYDEYISYDAIYCNDRSAGGGYISNKEMHYSAYTRLINKNEPSYQCGMNTTGGYTNSNGVWVSGGTTGTLYSDASESDKFKDGIGLITADEIIFAGGALISSPNIYYFRNSVSDCSSDKDDLCSVTGNKWWWTMTPNEYTDTYGIMLGVFASSNPNTVVGSLANLIVYEPQVIRPVISIKANTLISGSGTVTNPYEII